MFSTNSKFFLFLLSNRRNFIPILSIFFLTLDNTTANQIGMFTALWFLGTFLFEIPSWYFSDIFWHKKTLLLAKVIQASSILCFVSWAFLSSPYNFYIFALWSILQSIWFAFWSWTISAFYHDILEGRWDEKKFAVQFWKLRANVSLVSVFIIVALPFLTEISYLLPLVVWLWFDFLWFFALLFIVSPKKEHHLKEKKTILQLFKDVKVSGILSVVIFFSLIWGFLMADSPFRGPYLVELWYPVIFIWAVMWLSRIVWFIIGHNIHIIERYFNLKRLMIFEILFFSTLLVLISLSNNPYIVWIIFSIIIWYKWGRSSLITWLFLNDYINDKNFKATFLSITSQLTSMIWIAVTYFKWLIIFNYSYTVSYFILWISLFVLLIISYLFVFIEKRK
jgi:hypothetical protein